MLLPARAHHAPLRAALCGIKGVLASASLHVANCSSAGGRLMLAPTAARPEGG